MNLLRFSRMGVTFSLLFAAAGPLACAESGAAPTGAEQASAVERQEEADNGDAGGSPGPRITSVTANGTGCGEGRWRARVEADGQSVTLKLSDNRASLGEGEAFEIKDCTIRLKVEGAEGHAFTLESAEFVGFVSLSADGVRGRQTMKYYFMGNPTASESREKSFTSDDQASYTWSNEFGGAEAVWSQCGGGRDLNVQTRLVLNNNEGHSGWGYIGSRTLKLRLKSRPCT